MLKDRYNELKENETFLRVLKFILYFLTLLYSLNAIDYIAGRVYTYTDHIIGDISVPSGILDKLLYFIQIRYNYEASGLRFIINLFALTIISILILIVYRKFLSKASKILTSTTLMPPILYIIVFYLSLEDTESYMAFKTMWFVLLGIVICVAHATTTVLFLIKDANNLDD